MTVALCDPTEFSDAGIAMRDGLGYSRQKKDELIENRRGQGQCRRRQRNHTAQIARQNELLEAVIRPQRRLSSEGGDI